MPYKIEHLQDLLLTQLFENETTQKEISNSLNKLKSISISIVGVGGVGSIFAELLIRAGFVNITLIDGDVVEKSNLGRQLYNYEDIGSLKVKCLREKLLKIQNPEFNISISQVPSFLNKENIDSIIPTKISNGSKNSIIIDCTDNLNVRRIINSYAFENSLMWIYSGGEGFESIVSIFDYTKPGSVDLFSKFITNNHIQTSNCSSGVLNSTTTITASLIVKELLLYYCNLDKEKQNEIGKKKQFAKCIKFNLLRNKIFEFYIK